VPKLAAALQRERGTRRLAVSAALGALSALTFEPFRLFPLLLLAYGALVLLFDGARQGNHRFRDSLLIGWSFGFGFFLVGHYWIGYAFFVDAAAHAWQMPIAMMVMPLGLGLFYAGAGPLCMLAWRPGIRRVFWFAAVFFTSEWLRGHILTGFPWNLPAYGWAASPALLQSTAIFGAYGLSLLTLLFGASLASLASDSGRDKFLAVALALIFAGFWAEGAVRLSNAGQDVVSDVRLRVVQPSTNQIEKYDREKVAQNWRRLMDLSLTPAERPPTHIIWPEAAPPFFAAIDQVPDALDEVARLTGDSSMLLTGEVRVEQAEGRPRFYNSFAVFGPHAKLLATYDKFHLVPFGEYLPLDGILRSLGFSEIAADTGFSAGPGPKTIIVPGAPPIGPLICYEVIFPNEVTGQPRPQWLVNLTDDSWFGPNTGPMQHLLIARVRAIEEGLPIARAANSGISAVIDAYGRVRARLELGSRAVIDADLPAALPPTLFARYGNLLLLVLFALCVVVAVWPSRSSDT